MPQRGRADTKAALGHDSEDCTNAISQSNLRKYIAHARATCRPKLHAIDQNKVSCLYAELRRESANCGGIPIAVRHLESLMRMAEAQVS
jgi:DNA replication licensing factor MCM2